MGLLIKITNIILFSRLTLTIITIDRISTCLEELILSLLEDITIDLISIKVFINIYELNCLKYVKYKSSHS